MVRKVEPRRVRLISAESPVLKKTPLLKSGIYRMQLSPGLLAELAKLGATHRSTLINVTVHYDAAVPEESIITLAPTR